MPDQEKNTIEVAVARIQEQVSQIATDLKDIRGAFGRLDEKVMGVEERINQRLSTLASQMPSAEVLRMLQEDIEGRARSTHTLRLEQAMIEVRRDIEALKDRVHGIQAALNIIKWVGVAIGGLIITLIWQVITGQVKIEY